MKKLESTRDITLPNIFRVYKKGFGYSKLELIENSEYYLAAIADREFYIAVNNGDTIEAYLWVEDIASYEFTVDVIGRTINDPKILFLNHSDRMEWSEERKCLAAEVDLPVRFFIFNPGDSEKSISSEKIVFRHGNLVLLQDREAVIQSDTAIEDDVFLKGHININGEDIELVGKVSLLNEKKKMYNIIFSGISDKIRNILLEYIFKIYRE